MVTSSVIDATLIYQGVYTEFRTHFWSRVQTSSFFSHVMKATWHIVEDRALLTQW